MVTNEKSGPPSKEVTDRALRVQRIIYVFMGIMIVLPFILVWLSGAISFD